jgi:hypothetical protein
MLRAFGENVMGKVVIRDSVGAGRPWEDYGVKFVDLVGDADVSNMAQADIKNRSGIALLDDMLERYLDASDELYASPNDGFVPGPGQIPPASQTYKIFLQRLLSAATLSPHETFLHPVACVIAISSSNPSPIETLRQLYRDTSSQGDKKLPVYANLEYLRYYVLVHDEDRHDITKSTALFDQMKRHFGLHCHLLRLRSTQCLPTDDDSVELPPSEWMSPLEDLTSRGDQGQPLPLRISHPTNLSPPDLIALETTTPYVFESDVTAIRTFIREMVTQSIVPHMESRVSFWNDQVASKRRGISGRFMSLSKRWTGIGTSSRSSSSMASALGGGASGNFDAIAGFYKPETPEAILRKMADYAFMLRDWKLASTTYELLRTDFNDDKAWKYLAGANEMSAISTLLNPQTGTVKSLLESIEKMLETSSYSYLTRCSDPLSALRCLIVAVELLKIRGGLAAEAAAKWGIKILEFGLTGPIGQILVTERVSACYASKIGVGTLSWGSRRRKAALWTVLAADGWLRLGRPSFAQLALNTADKYYNIVLKTDYGHPFGEMRAFLEGLRHACKLQQLDQRGHVALDGQTETGHLMPEAEEEVSEKLDRRHRKSLIGAANPLDAPPLSPVKARGEFPATIRDDDFE